MSKNPITWWEIQVPDGEQAKAFYGGVFGWTFESWQDGYEVVKAGEDMIGGLSRTKGRTAGRHVHVVFTVDVHGDKRDDTLEESLRKVEKHGGKIVKDRTQISPDMGWFATVEDPSGLSFDLWTGRPAK